MALSDRQMLFVAAYSTDPNGSGAACKAGYAAGSAHVAASRLLRNAKVRDAIAERRAATASKLDLSRERVIRELVKAAELAETRGEPTGMVSAWQAVAKICGFYAPEGRKVEISTEGADLAHRLRQMSDAELLALASEAT